MLNRIRSVFQLTSAELGLAVAYMGVAFFGAVVSFSVVNGLVDSTTVIRPFSTYDYWIIIAGAIGAYAALFASGRWLGQTGILGWTKAIIAIPIISFFASLITGTLALPGHGTMFAPLALTTTMIENPLLALFWASMILVAHYRYVQWRAERDTIFNA